MEVCRGNFSCDNVYATADEAPAAAATTDRDRPNAGGKQPAVHNGGRAWNFTRVAQALARSLARSSSGRNNTLSPTKNAIADFIETVMGEPKGNTDALNIMKL